MDATANVKAPQFAKGDSVWLKPVAKRAMRYHCDDDPQSPLNRELTVIFVTDRGSGAYEYRVCAKGGKIPDVLVASEDCLTNSDGW